MHRILLITTLLATPVFAQDHTAMMDHSAHSAGMSENEITQPGQSAFAAIEEIILALDMDPNTDWSKVDISGLREHLRDMNLVFIAAEVSSEPVANGLRFTITGEGRVRKAIRNLSIAHAGVMEGVDDWHYVAETHPEGAVMTITVPSSDMPRLNGLGFFGVMAMGMHHQKHHWAMATGGNPHH
ncbi:MAG: hypothetical protein V3V13_13390 [Paracoccaceae bacterium]